MGHARFIGFDIASLFLKNQYIRLGEADQGYQKK